MDDSQRTTIERACERLVARYAHSVDLEARRGLRDIFAEDAIFEVNGQQIRGLEAIAGTSSADATPRFTRHVCANVLIDVDDESHAHGVSYLVAYVQPADDAVLGLPFVVGEYHDSYTLTNEGWRIAHRLFKPALRQAQGGDAPTSHKEDSND